MGKEHKHQTPRADTNFGNIIEKIENAAELPQLLAAIKQSRAMSHKFALVKKRQHQAHVVVAYAAFRKAKALGTLDQLVESIRAADKAITPRQSDFQVVARGCIDYGEDGAFAATRDSTVADLLDSRDISPSAAAEFIKEHGGLHKCYLLRCEERKGIEKYDSVMEPKLRGDQLRDLFPNQLQHQGDMAAVLVHLADERRGLIKMLRVVQLDGFSAAQQEQIESEFVEAMSQLVGLGDRTDDDSEPCVLLLNKMADVEDHARSMPDNRVED